MTIIFLDFDPVSAYETNGFFPITGENFHHIIKVLRMKSGDELFVTFDGRTHLCKLQNEGKEAGINSNCIFAAILQKDALRSELPARLHLFQGFPKGDKMEFIIQKAVELGVTSITPVKMHRSVVRLDEKKAAAKTKRFNLISKSAAEQSKRNIIPAVNFPISVKEAAQKAKDFDIRLACFEGETASFLNTLEIMQSFSPNTDIAIFIGPEGGFEKEEIELLKENGFLSISLGKRILRAETAAVAALALCMASLQRLEDENAAS